MRIHWRDRVPVAFLGLALLAALVTGSLPALWAFGDLLMDLGEGAKGLSDGVLWIRFGRMLLISMVTLGIAVPVGLVQGWLLARSDLPLKRFLLAITPFPLFLPPLVHVLAWFGAWQVRGVVAIVLVYVISFTPFVVLMVCRSLEQVSCSRAETWRLIGGTRLLIRSELREALPAALVGGSLALVFLLSDFSVADFLTSVGPKVTVYADSLYAHHLALRPAAAAAAAVPGLVVCLGLMLGVLSLRRRLGAAVGDRFSAASPVPLGHMRWPVFLVSFAIAVFGSLFPFFSLIGQIGEWEVFRQQTRLAGGHVIYSVGLAVAAATGMVLIGFPLSWLGVRLRRPWPIDLLIFLPLATPPLLYGVGLIRQWNRPGLDWMYVGAGLVIVALIGRYLAFVYLALGGAFERLDRPLFEAARLSGAGLWQRTRSIALPLLWSPLASAWCISFCFTLRELDTLIMLRGGQQALTFYLYSHVVFVREDQVASLALLLAIMTYAPLLTYLILARKPLQLI